MDESQNNRINTFLGLKGTCAEALSKSRLAKLELIDTAIQNRLSEIEKAKETLKNSSINISVISEDTHISRKTFYNNDIFKEYVESYATDNEEKTVSESELESVRFKNDELQKQINGFVLRDIETEDLRHVIADLQAEIKNLQNQNHTLEKQYALAQNELVVLKNGTPTTKPQTITNNNIVTLKPVK